MRDIIERCKKLARGEIFGTGKYQWKDLIRNNKRYEVNFQKLMKVPLGGKLHARYAKREDMLHKKDVAIRKSLKI